MNQESDYVDRASELIITNKYMTVATASVEGKPWVAPLAFAYDASCRFFWVSHRNSLHSRLIEQNHEVAIVIFDSSVPEGGAEGIYFDAVAGALDDVGEIEEALLLVNGRRETAAFGFAVPEQVSGQAVKRLYRATPRAVSRLDDDYVEGERINVRRPIDLTALQARLRYRI